MKLILLEKIHNLGVLGEEVNVKAGYGRNYLLPQGKAVVATKDNVKYFESKRAELEKAEQDRFQEAQKRADLINGLTVTIPAKVSDESKLYGSVGAIEILEAIKSQGIEVARQEIHLPNGPFRNIGEHEVTISLLHGEVNAQINLVIVPEKNL